MDWKSILAGVTAYLISVFASILLVFVTYRLNTILTSKIDEERYLLSGNRSLSITLGSVILSQAILLRHAVFPTMVVIRDLFLRPVSFASAMWVLAHCAAFFLIIGILSFGSVAVCTFLFTKMTGKVPEREEILKDNLAVGIFFAFAVLAMTLIVNEGLEDLAKSIIPYEQTGVIRLQ